jgi:hypothetical protein
VSGTSSTCRTCTSSSRCPMGCCPWRSGIAPACTRGSFKRVPRRCGMSPPTHAISAQRLAC